MLEKERRVQEALGLRKTSAELQGILDGFRRAETEARNKAHKIRIRQEQMYTLAERQRDIIIQSFRRASVKDYLKWLEGFFNNGGSPQYYYDYPFSRGDFYVAQCSLELHVLYGSMSFSLIVPVGIDVYSVNKVQGFGHINIFWMNGFKLSGGVPIYNDINFKGDINGTI